MEKKLKKLRWHYGEEGKKRMKDFRKDINKGRDRPKRILPEKERSGMPKARKRGKPV